MIEWLQILHVSDLHFGHGNANYRFDQKGVTETLIRDAAKIAERHGSPDLILVTGDVAFSADPMKEYPAATDWLRRLQQSTNPSARVFIVPGNHDVDRREASEFPMNYVHRGLRDVPTDIDGFFESSEKMRSIWPKLEAYSQFASGFGCVFTPEAPFGVETVETCLGRVNVALLNTALLSFDNDDSASNLLAGSAQIFTAVQKIPADTLLLVLQHHPTSWLRDGEMLRGAVAQRPSLMFSGHLHQQGAGFDLRCCRTASLSFPPAPAMAINGESIHMLGCGSLLRSFNTSRGDGCRRT